LLSPHQQGLLAIVIFKGLVEIVYLAENFRNIKMIIHIHGWYLWGVPPQHRFQPLFMPEFSVELTLDKYKFGTSSPSEVSCGTMAPRKLNELQINDE
jgi:hypothetical protein